MDAVLLDKLSHFVDQMLGNSESVETDSTSKKNMKSTSKEVKEERFPKEVKQEQKPKKSQQKNAAKYEEKNETVIKTKNSPRMKSDKDTKSRLTTDSVCKVEASPDKSERCTEDGFKIVSMIPDDDLDISDAFECDSEEDEFSYKSKNKSSEISSQPKKGAAKMTKDGFKIVSDIPCDDNDVSDAFDDDDDDGLGLDQDKGLEKHQSGSLKNVKKPILQMISDFGIDSDILLGRTRKSEDMINHQQPLQHKPKGYPVSSLTLAAKKRKKSDVTVFDYSQKRGANKKKKHRTDSEPQEEKNDVQPEKMADDKVMKNVRYDVFKFGMSGFNKKEKEDARVALAVKLGAKPPKKKAINYKELLEKKQEDKRKFEEEQEQRRQQGLKALKMIKSSKSVKKPIVKLSSGSQVGRFQNGVQMLSKKDIAKITGSAK